MRESVRYCSHCGAKLLDKAVVCVKCGWRVPPINFEKSQFVSTSTNSKKTYKNIIIGIYGFSGVLGVFCGLVPVIGIIIVSICLNAIYAGFILLIIGVIYLLIQRGVFGWAFIIFGVTTAMLLLLYRYGLIENITTYIQNIKNSMKV